MYGSIGAIFGDDPDQVADYLGRVAETAAPFDLLIESPFVTRGIEPQIEIFGRLRDRLAAKGIPCTIIADEWCNTLEDIRAWCAAGTTDMVQIKTPDLGGLDCTIDAAMASREAGMRFYLGGTANETHQSALIATHVALATRPEFTQAKPGLGGDESYALVLNEMTRTIDVLDRLGSPWMQ